MEIKLIRKIFSDKSTLSDIIVDDEFICNALKDFDRDLDQSMELEEIKKIKVHGKTAIPTGRYEIANTYSERFKKYLPLLLDVKGYAGIRIHPGNKAEDTEGCILPGSYHEGTDDFVFDSKYFFEELFTLIKGVEKREKIYITISRERSNDGGEDV